MIAVHVEGHDPQFNVIIRHRYSLQQCPCLPRMLPARIVSSLDSLTAKPSVARTVVDECLTATATAEASSSLTRGGLLLSLSTDDGLKNYSEMVIESGHISAFKKRSTSSL